MTRGIAADLIHRWFRNGVRAAAPSGWLARCSPRTLLLIAILLQPAPVSAAAPSLESAVKATYLYKFTPYITWPESAFAAPNAPFNICIIGNDAFADLVAQAVAGQRYGTHDMAVRKLAAPDTGCQILYIADSESAALSGTLGAARGKPILTVTDITPGPTEAHGIIVFINDAGHVRFDIDGTAAAQDGLTISSKLLSLSRSANQKSAP